MPLPVAPMGPPQLRERPATPVFFLLGLRRWVQPAPRGVRASVASQ